jgi:hypothetical protein
MEFLKKLFKREQPIEVIAMREDQHVHQWEQRAVTFAPPIRWMGNSTTNLSERLAFGVTSILSECIVCHETRTEELLGCSTTPLDELIDKINMYGTQFIQRDNITYMFQKYQPPAGGLPLR